jgi:hypothetical protein
LNPQKPEQRQDRHGVDKADTGLCGGFYGHGIKNLLAKTGREGAGLPSLFLPWRDSLL